jgi:hypothetical protein
MREKTHDEGTRKKTKKNIERESHFIHTKKRITLTLLQRRVQVTQKEEKNYIRKRRKKYKILNQVFQFFSCCAFSFFKRMKWNGGVFWMSAEIKKRRKKIKFYKNKNKIQKIYCLRVLRHDKTRAIDLLARDQLRATHSDEITRLDGNA